MEGMIIREYTKNDATKLLLFMLAEEQWKTRHPLTVNAMHEADNTIEQTYVAEKDGAILGYIYGFVLPNKTLIPEFLYVHPDYRKQGVGSSLLNHFEKVTNCVVSQIFYHNSLHDYYCRQGYEMGGNLEVAVKRLD